MSIVNYPRRTNRIIIFFMLSLFVIVFLLLFLVLGTTGQGTLSNFLIFVLVFLFVLPLIGLIVNRIAGPSPKTCPRCNIPVTDYAEYCKNCGLELLIRCPNCSKFQRAEQMACKNCGFVLKGTIPLKRSEKEDYVIIQEGAKAPNKTNFCPNCGSSLKNAENLRYCEYCGSKIT